MSSIHSSLRDSKDDLGLLTEELLPQFHLGQNGSRISLSLTEAEDLKKRWQEYTEELYKKDLHDPDNPDDVVTNLEPDMEYEVKWALESITTKLVVEVMEFQLSYFKS